MTVKSIFEIEVKDGEYNKFIEKYKDYQSSLDEMPSAWAKIGKSIHGAAEKFVLPPITAKQAKEMGRQLTESEKDALKSSKERAKSWKEMERSSVHFAKNVAGATVSMFKWVGITSAISGLLGAGGLFGLDRLANSVSTGRRSSQGLGVSTGEQKAFGLNFGRYVDADSNLANIADAKSNYANRWAFSAMGVGEADIQKKDPAQLAVEMALKAKEIFDKGDQSQQYAQAHGLLQFYTMDELRRLHETSIKDLEESSTGYAHDKNKLNLDDNVQKKWQDFSIQMHRAGDQIENVFVNALAPLVPELTRLSNAFAGAIDAFMRNPDVKNWISNFAVELQELGTYLGSPEFKNDIYTFVTAISQLARETVRALRFFHLIPGSDDAGSASGELDPDEVKRETRGRTSFSGFKKREGTLANGHPFGVLGTTSEDTLNTPFNRKWLGYDSNHDFTKLEDKYALPNGLMDNIWYAESRRSKNPGTSVAGAMGPFQLMPGTAKQYGVTDRMDFTQSSEAAAHIMEDLLKQFHGDVEKAAAAYNWGSGNLSKDIAKYGDHWKDHLPAETAAYVKTTTSNLSHQTAVGAIIRIENNTGGSAVVTTNQVAY